MSESMPLDSLTKGSFFLYTWPKLHEKTIKLKYQNSIKKTMAIKLTRLIRLTDAGDIGAHVQK